MAGPKSILFCAFLLVLPYGLASGESDLFLWRVLLLRAKRFLVMQQLQGVFFFFFFSFVFFIL